MVRVRNEREGRRRGGRGGTAACSYSSRQRYTGWGTGVAMEGEARAYCVFSMHWSAPSAESIDCHYEVEK